MHEYSIVSALLTQVEGHARRHGAAAVHRVRVSLGELSGVDPELLAAAYDLARAGGVCAAAALEVEPVAARWECPRCAEVLPPRSRLACAACGTPARLAAGDEIVLASLELDIVDDREIREASHV